MTKATDDSKIARALATLKSGDSVRIQELCHPDLTVSSPESLPYGGTYTGLAGLSELVGGLYATWADCEITTEAIIGDPSGDEFVLVQHMTGRSAKTGRPFEMSILEQYSFRDGRLIAIRPYYWDTKALVDF